MAIIRKLRDLLQRHRYLASALNVGIVAPALLIAYIALIGTPELIIDAAAESIDFRVPVAASRVIVRTKREISLLQGELRTERSELGRSTRQIPFSPKAKGRTVEVDTSLAREVFKGADSFVMSLYVDRAEILDLISVVEFVIDGAPVAIETVHARHLISRHHLQRRETVPSFLANQVRVFNQSVAPLILLVMTSLTACVGYALVGSVRRLRTARAPLPVQAIGDSGETLELLAVLGPSVGFLLTVTSLLDAMRPSPAMRLDVPQYMFSNIYIALVSTCLGLCIRILSVAQLRLLERLSRKQEGVQ